MICVVGATSFIGRHLLSTLLSAEPARLRLLLHQSNHATTGSAVELFHGDLLDAPSLVGFIERGAIVINLAFLAKGSFDDNLTAARNLAEACARGGAKRLVHVSTAVVAGSAASRCVDENTVCRPSNPYEKTKLAVEETLTLGSQEAFELVILRPSAVFGDGGRNLVSLAGRVSRARPVIRYLLACMEGRRRMNAVPAQTVAAAIAFLAAEIDLSQGRTFIISDDESENNNYRYIEDRFLTAFGLAPYPLPVMGVPAFVLRAALFMTGRHATDPRRGYSCQRILSLGFVKPVTFESALADYARSLART